MNNMNNLKKFAGLGVLSIIAFLSIRAIKLEKDALHKKKFDITLYEMVNGKAKPKPAKEKDLEFTNGKLYIEYLYEKYSVGQIKYDLKKDSTYLDEDIEKRYFELEATTEKDGYDYKVFIKIDNYEMEGKFQQLKNDKVKKEGEFTGTEKAQKKK